MFINSITQNAPWPPTLYLNISQASFEQNKTTLFNEYFHSVYNPCSLNTGTFVVSDKSPTNECITDLILAEDDVYESLQV